MQAAKNHTYNTGTIPTRISIFCLDSASIVFKRLQTFSFFYVLHNQLPGLYL